MAAIPCLFIQLECCYEEFSVCFRRKGIVAFFSIESIDARNKLYIPMRGQAAPYGMDLQRNFAGNHAENIVWNVPLLQPL